MNNVTDIQHPPQASATDATAIKTLRERLLSPIPRLSIAGTLGVLAFLIVLTWAASAVQPDWLQIARGKTPIQAVFDFVKGMFPAEYVYSEGADSIVIGSTVISYPIAIRYVTQTVQMALIGTLLGVILSIPFGLLAARNTSPHPVIYQGTRFILNSIRAIPELIWALIFVSAVGLGPFSGVVALAVAGVGAKGKLYAEAIEAIDPQQVLAVRATGAGSLQIFMYAVLPQALPVVLSYSLLSFESNVRAATILGYVGAGGIGLLLYQYIQLFQYERLMGIIIIIVVTVTVIDRISDFLRRKFI